MPCDRRGAGGLAGRDVTPVDPAHHNVIEFFVNWRATTLKLGECTQIGAVLLTNIIPVIIVVTESLIMRC